MNANPLVSVAVVTFNSAPYIEETLDSVLSQTYKNIELIISDDCSSDNTVSICQKWLRNNSDSFARTKLITVDKNTGVSANYNRAYNECRGEWIKDLDGDDLLLPTCIEDNINYITVNPSSILVFSRAIIFGMSPEKCDYYDKTRFDYSFFDKEPCQQYEMLKYGSCIPSTPAFFNRQKFIDLELKCDERIPLLEDRIKWLNAIKKGIRFDFFDKRTVKYRILPRSISNYDIASPKFEETKLLAFFYYVFQDEYCHNEEKAVNEAVSYYMKTYNYYYQTFTEYQKLKRNFLVKIVLGINNPAKAFHKLFGK